MQKNFKNSPFIILGILFILNILAWVAVYDLSQPRFLEVTFFDVGQGDAIFIETPGKNQILIDGGPGSVILEKLNEKLPFWDRTIDLVILTHPDDDHLSGLIDVLKSYKVKNILWSGVVKDTGTFRKWQKLIEKEKANIFIAEAGQKITEGKTSFEILFPFESLENRSFQDANNTSIVLKLDFGEISFLFTGDAYKSTEKELAQGGIDIRSEVLKVGHHGSKTSSAEEFIKEVLARVAVISVGANNRYGHPHPETLETLARYGINVLRTDEMGDIIIFSDGENFKIKR